MPYFAAGVATGAALAVFLWCFAFLTDFTDALAETAETCVPVTGVADFVSAAKTIDIEKSNAIRIIVIFFMVEPPFNFFYA
jgi:hypothetical protein